jgi:hypothetical protein
MNVLILTPDRVGSTLLQRLVTIYMLRKGFDKPVINLHELTNGLEKYYNTTLNQEVIGKPKGTEWGYYQKLDEIEELLKSVDHYKTSRLAHYHILNRQDTIAEQLKFYEYLNNNFYIISCRRDNLFEHALSWVINAHSKKLNVYSIEEKINIFGDIYNNGIVATQQSLTNHLTKYKNYINWTEQYFNVQSYFNYDTDISNIEKYVLSLDFMKDNYNNSWKDMFGQTFNDWNACHRLLPNLKLVQNPDAHNQITFFEKTLTHQTWQELKGPDWPQTPEEFISNSNSNVPVHIKEEILKYYKNSMVTVAVTNTQFDFLNKNLDNYVRTGMQLHKLVEDGFLVTSVPIKLQSLKEKKMIIRNFDQCTVWYNNWVNENNFGKLVDLSSLDKTSEAEERLLNAPIDQQNFLQ